MLKEIHRARQLYLLNGGPSNDQDLNHYPDLQIPAGSTLGCVLGKKDNGDCVNGDSWLKFGKFQFATGTAHAYHYYKKGPFKIEFKLPVHWAGESEREKGKIKCSAMTKGDTKSENLCKLLSGGKEPTTCSYVSGNCWLID